MNEILFKCSECGKVYPVKKKTYNEKLRTGKTKCKSCGIKGGKHDHRYGRRKEIRLHDKVNLNCHNCGNLFEIKYKRANKRKEKYGVDLCMSCSRKGDRNPFFGLRFSDEKKSELGQLRKDFYEDPVLGEIRRLDQSERWSGENNPMWKGAVERSDYTWRNKKWREDILNLFNYTCGICKQIFSEDKLIAHHLNGANWDIENRLNLDNGVCLCDKDHKAFHSKFGYGDNTKEQYDEFVKMKGSETIESISVKDRSE